jgi:hypothetical protein
MDNEDMTVDNEGLEITQESNTSAELQNISHITNALIDGRFYKLLAVDSKTNIKTECQICLPKTIHQCIYYCDFQLKKKFKSMFYFILLISKS